MTDLQHGVERCMSKLSRKVKLRGLHAFAHLRMAWGIRALDPAMAMFRAITAEEEAATALMLSFKYRQYPQARFLQPRSHPYKAAVTPFLNAIARSFETIGYVQPSVRLNEKATPPTVTVLFDVNRLGLKTSEPMTAVLDEPLNFTVGVDGRRYAFDRELQEIVNSKGVAEIVNFIEREANIRNQILYASDEGIPEVDLADDYILERLRRVTLLLIVAIAVEQTPMHQLFAAQCLHAFLVTVQKIEQGKLDESSPSRHHPLARGRRPLLLMETTQNADGTLKTKVGYLTPHSGTFSYGFCPTNLIPNGFRSTPADSGHSAGAGPVDVMSISGTFSYGFSPVWRCGVSRSG